MKKIMYALLFAAGMVTGAGLTMTNIDRGVERKDISGRESSLIECMVHHEEFVNKLPNYDCFGLWLGGDSYEDWMIEDINQRYQRRYP